MEPQNPSSPPLPPPPPPPPPQPPSQEPEPEQPTSKKPKLSTTTSDDETNNLNITTTEEKKPRYKRRKVAILFAYCGVGYQGMQKNPGAKTIEGDLEEALYFSGAVPESDRNCPKRFDFARSARTDKGVSAVGQVVSGKFYVDPDGFIDRLNNNLPDQFRVFGFKRVTPGFSAKKFCDRRRYVYLLPVFALDPDSHRDRESVLASLGSGNELVKCLECSERGRKAGYTDSGVVVKEDSVTSLGNGVVVECESVETITTTEVEVEVEVEVQSGVSSSVFSYGDKEKERLNKILKQYEGTHNFHNFTTRTKSNDPSANRYIISFNANTTVTVDGIEFVKCEVVGQSFMLHQIRKMIGVAVAIMRNCAPESLMESALKQDVRINVPTAPEVGLYLDECFFSSYNQKWRDTHEEVSMKDYAQEAEEFKLKYIYSHIASTEHKEGAVAVWLHSLNYRNYPDLCPEGNGGGNEVPRAEAEEINGCKGPHNQNSNPYNGGDIYRKLVASGKLGVQPIHDYGKPRVFEIDLEHLATTMKNRLNIIIPFIERLRNCYHGESETIITETIISDVNMMVDTAISVTYNRLRYVLQRYDPTVFVARMNPRSPLSNKYKFPAFISFVLGNIGPLRIMEWNVLVVYATSASRSQTYGREQQFDFKYGQYSRIVDNLAEIGVPLAPIDVKVGDRDGSFFSTIIPNLENGLWDFTATFHPSHYKYQDLGDLMSAWLTMNDDPALRAFKDCSLRIECCTNPDVVNAVMASRPEGVPDDLDGATAPTRPIGLIFNVNVFGIRPAVAAEGGNPALPAAVYIVGRGTKRYCCTSIARRITEYDMIEIVQYYMFRTPSSSTNF